MPAELTMKFELLISIFVWRARRLLCVQHNIPACVLTTTPTSTGSVDKFNAPAQEDIILQSALVDESDINEKKYSEACVMFGGCSQCSYEAKAFKDMMNLKRIKNQVVDIKKV